MGFSQAYKRILQFGNQSLLERGMGEVDAEALALMLGLQKVSCRRMR